MVIKRGFFNDSFNDNATEVKQSHELFSSLYWQLSRLLDRIRVANPGKDAAAAYSDTYTGNASKNIVGAKTLIDEQIANLSLKQLDAFTDAVFEDPNNLGKKRRDVAAVILCAWDAAAAKYMKGEDAAGDAVRDGDLSKQTDILESIAQKKKKLFAEKIADHASQQVKTTGVVTSGGSSAGALVPSLPLVPEIPSGPPAPIVTSITPNTGLTSGGTAITDLAGTNFVTGATVKIGGVSATSVVFVSSTKLTCVTPASLTAGAKNVVVTNPDTQTSGASGNSLFTYTVFDPTTLVLSSYQRSYTTLPWNGTASAGNSALYKENANPSIPALGTPALNGVSGAQYTRSGRASMTALVSNSSAVMMESLVSNSAYTVSFLIDMQSAAKLAALVYQQSSVLQSDAHWGWCFSSTAGMSGQTALTFNAAARTIVRGTGSFVTDAFVAGQTVYIRRTVSNNGFVAATLSGVTATTLTFNVGAALVDESTLLADDVCISSGPYTMTVFNYTGTFPAVTITVTPGVHWYYIRRTSSGTIQIDVDGVPGTPTALVDHLGASGIQAKTNSPYPPLLMDFIMFERFTSLVSQTTTERDNYKSYLNVTYGLSY